MSMLHKNTGKLKTLLLLAQWPLTSSFILNLNKSVPKSSLFIGHTITDTTINLSSVTDVWQNFTTSWSSGSSTTATIGLVNQNIATNGNNFVMNDIVFAPVYHHDIAVTLNPNPVLSVTGPSPLCIVYDLTTAINGYDSSTYNYFFTDPAGNNITLANARIISQSGTYTIISQNKSTGCHSAPKSVSVIINPAPANPTVSSS